MTSSATRAPPAPNRCTSLWCRDTITVRGLGTVRPGRDAFRVGPLYADAPEVAAALMTQLLSAVAKQAAAIGDRDGGGDVAAALQGPLVDIDVPTANVSAR
jgi:hypothetical protein